ncbi:MAG: hypothetical protein HN576_10400 [Bacteriovoracaceae bacterium]|jgi:hypothetical protein|nr:hypothetical protein [Bacteriovoracaceae bacterium]
MKLLIALVVCALFSTSSFSSSTGTSAKTNSEEPTQAISDILSGDNETGGDCTSGSRFLICIDQHKKRCLQSYSADKCRVILTRFCKNKPETDRFKFCVKSNLRRCLAHYSMQRCRVLLTNACSVTDQKEWDRKCVSKYANRCVQSMLTRRECIEALEPICKK